MILECWDKEPDNRPAMNKVVEELNAIITKTNIVDCVQMKNDESNIRSSDQKQFHLNGVNASSSSNNSFHGESSRKIQNFNQMNAGELELNNEESVIIYDDTIISLEI